MNDSSDRTIDLVEVVDESGLTSTQIKNRYSHGGQIDEPVSLEVFNADGSFDQAYTYHADHLGSIRFITDSVGEVVNAYDHDSYGRPGFTLEAIDQPFRFTGREFDQATELYHYRARQYDPETGKFLQDDPRAFGGEDFNVTRYAVSNPINRFDPAGLTAALSRSQFDKAATKSAGKAGLSITPRLGCFFSIVEQALNLALDQRVDIVEIGSDCVVRTKARKPSSGSPKHPGNARNPSKNNHVYVIFTRGASKRDVISKVGISSGPLNRRGRSQLKSGQRIMFIGTNLNRAQALALECTITWALVLALDLSLIHI